MRYFFILLFLALGFSASAQAPVWAPKIKTPFHYDRIMVDNLYIGTALPSLNASDSNRIAIVGGALFNSFYNPDCSCSQWKQSGIRTSISGDTLFVGTDTLLLNTPPAFNEITGDALDNTNLYSYIYYRGLPTVATTSALASLGVTYSEKILVKGVGVVEFSPTGTPDGKTIFPGFGGVWNLIFAGAGGNNGKVVYVDASQALTDTVDNFLVTTTGVTLYFPDPALHEGREILLTHKAFNGTINNTHGIVFGSPYVPVANAANVAMVGQAGFTTARYVSDGSYWRLVSMSHLTYIENATGTGVELGRLTNWAGFNSNGSVRLGTLKRLYGSVGITVTDRGDSVSVELGGPAAYSTTYTKSLGSLALSGGDINNTEYLLSSPAWPAGVSQAKYGFYGNSMNSLWYQMTSTGATFQWSVAGPTSLRGRTWNHLFSLINKDNTYWAPYAATPFVSWAMPLYITPAKHSIAGVGIASSKGSTFLVDADSIPIYITNLPDTSTAGFYRVLMKSSNGTVSGASLDSLKKWLGIMSVGTGDVTTAQLADTAQVLRDSIQILKDSLLALQNRQDIIFYYIQDGKVYAKVGVDGTPAYITSYDPPSYYDGKNDSTILWENLKYWMLWANGVNNKSGIYQDSVTVNLLTTGPRVRVGPPSGFTNRVTLQLSSITNTAAKDSAVQIDASGNIEQFRKVRGGVQSGTYSQRPSSPQIGDLYYQTDQLEGQYLYDGIKWVYTMDQNTQLFAGMKGSIAPYVVNTSGTGSNYYQNSSRSSAFEFTTGTTTTGVAQARDLGSNTAVPTSGKVIYAYKAAVATLSNSTDRFIVRLGKDAADGKGNYFRYSDDLSTGAWECVSHNGTTPTVTSSGVTVAAGTDYTFVVVYDTQATTDNAKFYINGNLVATHTTTLPADFGSNGYAGAVSIIKSLGTSARSLIVDEAIIKIIE